MRSLFLLPVLSLMLVYDYGVHVGSIRSRAASSVDELGLFKAGRMIFGSHQQLVPDVQIFVFEQKISSVFAFIY